MKYIVVNSAGLFVRSKPDTKTGQVIRKMTNGEGFTATNIFTVGAETWARLTHADSVIQQYCMILIVGRPAFALPQEAQAEIQTGAWTQAVDTFLRSKGYTGPRP